jgi:hypothetical protein
LLDRCSLRFRWMRAKGSRRGHFIVLRCVRPSDHHRCFHTLPCLCIPHAHRIPQATSLPRHRQAMRLQCFYHWCVIGAFIAASPCSPPRGERAPLMLIACPVFSSFSLDERQWIETMALHRFAARQPLDHHRCFHCCFHTLPCLCIPRANRDLQVTG